MTIWVDAQLSPSIALWMNLNFPDIEAKSLRSIGLRDAMDQEIFERGKLENVVIMTKDSFCWFIAKIWPTSEGNFSNIRKYIK
jgi:predicted nuclease of predicted toxin-antitoxin system